MKKTPLPILALLLLCAPAIAQSRACDYGAPICEASAEADAIFVGEVRRIVPATTRMWQTQDDYDQTAYVTVHKVLKGTKRRGIVLRQMGSRHAQKFIPGGTYLFYANYVPALKIWEVRQCGPTRMAKYAQTDLRYLSGLPANAGRTHIAGEVTRFIPDRYAEEAPSRLAGVQLSIVGEGREYELTTDVNGDYEIYDVRPGRYTVRIKPPRGLVFLWAIHSGRDPISRAKSLEVELKEGGCAEMDILLTPEKSLKGDGQEKIGKYAPGVHHLKQ
jgi:hypothetical protein